MLNVTSQRWLDESKVKGPDGSLWTHEAIVIVPKTLKYTNVSMAYLTKSCNEVPNRFYDPYKDYDILFGDMLAFNSHAITVVVKNIPNCYLEFANDPFHKRRHEDDILAMAWTEYLNDPSETPDPKWLTRLPMTKAGY